MFICCGHVGNKQQPLAQLFTFLQSCELSCNSSQHLQEAEQAGIVVQQRSIPLKKLQECMLSGTYLIIALVDKRRLCSSTVWGTKPALQTNSVKQLPAICGCGGAYTGDAHTAGQGPFSAPSCGTILPTGLHRLVGGSAVSCSTCTQSLLQVVNAGATVVVPGPGSHLCSCASKATIIDKRSSYSKDAAGPGCFAVTVQQV